MPKLPVISGKDAIRKFEKIGYRVSRQRGSHVRMIPLNKNSLAFTVPLHGTLRKGLLSQLVKDARISVEEFKKL